MLIDLLSQTLERSSALENFWGKLDAGADATIGVASSARPFLVAARFAERPQPTLVVVPGEETAETFARMLGAYVGDEKVYLYRETRRESVHPRSSCEREGVPGARPPVGTSS